MTSSTPHQVIYAREYWTGDSRDGRLVNGDGYHYYRLTKDGVIQEAYEYYELDDGTSVACPLPEMINIDWFKDLGYEDMEVLDLISENDFQVILDLLSPTSG